MSGGLAHLGHLKRLLARRSVVDSVAELTRGLRSRYSTISYCSWPQRLAEKSLTEACIQVPDFANMHTASVVMSAPEAVCFPPTTYCEASWMRLLHPSLFASLPFHACITFYVFSLHLFGNGHLHKGVSCRFCPCLHCLQPCLKGMLQAGKSLRGLRSQQATF